MDGTSVILHVDLDCFYAAVEHVRLGIPRERPLAVQQWEGLIAVNYAARASGVVRHDRVSEALRKCPDLHLVHVETVGSDREIGGAYRRETMKVSLERYRQASKYIFEIFHQYADICERASIDEAYLDVTNKVEVIVEKGCDRHHELQQLVGSHQVIDKMVSIKDKVGMIAENDIIEVQDTTDRRLLAGAIIAEQIRTDVRTKLGYTCSVGIATNKLLAKIASARHKPDQQTIIFPEAVPNLMNELPLKKVKLLGGKIGEHLSEKYGCKTAGEVQKVPLKHLLALLGDRLGHYVYKAVRGLHEDKVQEKEVPKSMLAAKSFQATQDITVIRRWLGVLAEELSVRMLRDAKENHRQPHSLHLYYRSGFSQQTGDHSKSCAMPPAVLHLLSSLSSSNLHLASPSFASLQDLQKEHDIHFHRMNTPTEDNGSKLLEPLRQNREVNRTETKIELLDIKRQELTGSDSRILSDLQARDRDSQNIGSTLQQDKVTDDVAKELARLLQEASFRLLQSIGGVASFTRLAISASGFHDAPMQGSHSIRHFFSGEVKKPTSCKPLSVPMPLDSDKLVHMPSGILRYVNNKMSTQQGLPCSDARQHLFSKMNDSESQRTGSAKCQFAEAPDCSIVSPCSETTPLHEFEVSESSCSELAIQQGALDMSHIGVGVLVDETKAALCTLAAPQGADNLDMGLMVSEEIDLKMISVEEQRRILEQIYSARAANQTSTSVSQEKLGSSNKDTNSSKRRRLKNGQASLSNYFQSAAGNS